MRKAILATVLASAIWLGACAVPSWVTTVENDAEIGASIALSLVAVVDPALVPVVTLINTGLAAISATTKTFESSPTVTNLQAIQAGIAAVQANLAQLESAAQVKNAATGDKITAIVQVVAGVVAEIAAQVPASAAAASLTGSSTTLKPHGAAYFKHQFNKIVKGDGRFRPLR